MPAKPFSRPPKYSLHKASGQALVRLNSRDIYLGKHGSPESHERYARIVAQWTREVAQWTREVAQWTREVAQWTREQRIEESKKPLGKAAQNLSSAARYLWYRPFAENY